jgi:ABC-type Fe3+/spermidine/putrescine transport system ATPase subunit
MDDGRIALQRVSKHYGGATVVDEVSAEIASGEFFTVLGPSGSGKSTTLSMIAGFVIPDSGGIALGGRDMTRAAPRERALGMVFQNYAIFPHLNVFENVAFPLRARRAAASLVQSRVAAALAMVRLAGMERRFARQLSGGQQQRVALARAIVAQPAIVLMDEPLGALDKNLRYHMQTEIKDIQRRLGMTVVFVTHDQEEAMNMSDRIAIMDAGRIVQMGRPRDVYEQPETEFVARFLGEANLVPGRAEGTALRTGAGVALRAANAASGAAHLFVRPEKVSLQLGAGAGDAGSNRLDGRVARSAFLGNVIRTELDVGGAEPVIIDTVNGPTAQLLAPGTQAAAVWAVADSRLLADG